jgi:hypothetical protein
LIVASIPQEDGGFIWLVTPRAPDPAPDTDGWDHSALPGDAEGAVSGSLAIAAVQRLLVVCPSLAAIMHELEWAVYAGHYQDYATHQWGACVQPAEAGVERVAVVVPNAHVLVFDAAREAVRRAAPLLPAANKASLQPCTAELPGAGVPVGVPKELSAGLQWMPLSEFFSVHLAHAPPELAAEVSPIRWPELGPDDMAACAQQIAISAPAAVLGVVVVADHFKAPPSLEVMRSSFTKCRPAGKSAETEMQIKRTYATLQAFRRSNEADRRSWASTWDGARSSSSW